MQTKTHRRMSLDHTISQSNHNTTLHIDGSNNTNTDIPKISISNNNNNNNNNDSDQQLQQKNADINHCTNRISVIELKRQRQEEGDVLRKEMRKSQCRRSINNNDQSLIPTLYSPSLFSDGKLKNNAGSRTTSPRLLLRQQADNQTTFDNQMFSEMSMDACLSMGDRLRYLCKTGAAHFLDKLLTEEISKHEECAATPINKQRDSIMDEIPGSSLVKQIFDLSSQYLDSNNNFCSLLHTSARYGQLECVQLLIEKYNMNVDCIDRVHATPLFYAVASGKVESATYLLSMGASVNIKDNYENTPLLLALKYESAALLSQEDITVTDTTFEMCKVLLLFKADIHLKVSKGNSLLHIACESGDEAVIQFLLNNGASISRTNRANETPIFSVLPYAELIETLCKHVTCEKDASRTHALFKVVQIRSGNGQTVFHKCCSDGHLESLKELLRAMLSSIEDESSREAQEIIDMIKSALNDVCVKRGWTPLHYAVHADQAMLVQFLCSLKEVDVDIGDKSTQSTPLHLAITKNNERSIRALVDIGKANKKAKNINKISCRKLAKSQNIPLKVTGRSKRHRPDLRPVLNELINRYHPSHNNGSDRKRSLSSSAVGLLSSVVSIGKSAPKTLFGRSKSSTSDSKVTQVDASKALEDTDGFDTTSTITDTEDMEEIFSPSSYICTLTGAMLKE